MEPLMEENCTSMVKIEMEESPQEEDEYEGDFSVGGQDFQFSNHFLDLGEETSDERNVQDEEELYIKHEPLLTFEEFEEGDGDAEDAEDAEETKQDDWAMLIGHEVYNGDKKPRSKLDKFDSDDEKDLDWELGKNLKSRSKDAKNKPPQQKKVKTCQRTVDVRQTGQVSDIFRNIVDNVLFRKQIDTFTLLPPINIINPPTQVSIQLPVVSENKTCLRRTAAAKKTVKFLAAHQKLRMRLTCVLCSKDFKTFRGLLNHLYSYIDLFRCSSCSKSFAMEASCFNHIKREHNGNSVVDSGVYWKSTNSSRNPPESCFLQCTNCKAVLHSELQLISHYKKKHKKLFADIKLSKLIHRNDKPGTPMWGASYALKESFVMLETLEKARKKIKKAVEVAVAKVAESKAVAVESNHNNQSLSTHHKVHKESKPRHRSPPAPKSKTKKKEISEKVKVKEEFILPSFPDDDDLDLLLDDANNLKQPQDELQIDEFCKGIKIKMEAELGIPDFEIFPENSTEVVANLSSGLIPCTSNAVDVKPPKPVFADPVEGELSCGHCEKTFVNQMTLQRHVRTHVQIVRQHISDSFSKIVFKQHLAQAKK